MSLSSAFLRFLCFICLLTSAGASVANSGSSFVFDVTAEPKRLGDLKPSYLAYKEQELPPVSIEYVLKRYIKLFETASSPAVRVDALNRINNLRAKYGLSSKKLSIDSVKQSQAVLESYDRIVDAGVSYQRMDELLYQTAKATSFIGDLEGSIKRLNLLIGLYPKSKLFDESQFRIAESYFDLGEFLKAEAEYKKILAFSNEDKFHQRVKFKLGWALFRLNKYLDSGKVALGSLDYYPGLKKAVNLDDTPELYHNIVEDTFRLLSILFAKQADAESIEELQKATANYDYAFLLYDRLFNFYLSQERYEDAAKVTIAYTDHYPKDFYAYRMALNTIKSYAAGDFDIKEWKAKEQLVTNFGIRSGYWKKLNNQKRMEVKPHLVTYLNELAHLYYIRMQNSKESQLKGTHAHQSADYYLELAATDLESDKNGEYVYLAAEATNVAQNYDLAIQLYDRSAYVEPQHKYAVKAGYAAILTYDQFEDAEGKLQPDKKLARRDHIEKYAAKFEDDIQTPALLAALSTELLEDKAYSYAVITSDRVIKHPKASSQQQYASWLVSAHSHFALESYHSAELAYQAALGYKQTEDRASLRERLAASIYRQAEIEKDPAISAKLFLKVVDVVPEASIVSQALYDASVKQLLIKDWPGAIASLGHFQQAFPENNLYEDATEKLIFAYTNNKEPLSAAEKLVELADSTSDKERAKSALFQAAEYYQKGDFAYEATQLYERFVSKYSDSFELSLEAYDRIIAFYNDEGLAKSADDWRSKLIGFEQANKTNRTDRSAYLAANALFTLSEADFTAFNQAKLTLPLKKSLKRKRQLMDTAVKQYEGIADYNVSVFTSAATFKIAEIYRSLATELMASERPTSLDELQLEQYDILLEEQAYPFEEQALEIYSINTAKVPDGYYDEWIAKTYEVLSEMNPTEYYREPKGISHAADIY